MPRLVFLDSAKCDLAEIASYIERESMDRERAEVFVDKLITHCQMLASRPVVMGRVRPELRAEYRSVTFGNYVIFLTYTSDGTSPRDVMKVVHVLWGARDLDAYFRDYSEIDDNGATS
jgi:toxin ParE1/3/4